MVLSGTVIESTGSCGDNLPGQRHRQLRQQVAASAGADNCSAAAKMPPAIPTIAQPVRALERHPANRRRGKGPQQRRQQYPVEPRRISTSVPRE